MEEKTAAFYLVEGSTSLSSLQKSTGFYPLALGLVANGLERLLKIAIVAGTLNSTGTVPDRADFRRWSHDLATLSDVALRPSTTSAISARQLISKDRVLSTLLGVLSDFARDGRYVYMDQLLNPPRQPNDPTRGLRLLEDEIFRATSDSDSARDSWLFGHVLRGEIALYIRRRNEFIIESLLRFVSLVTELFVDQAGLPEAGYMRVFLGERRFGQTPSPSAFRKVANSPELEAWEVQLVETLAS